MSVGLQLILSTALVAAPAGCSWAHPGANPYRGDPVRALADFDMAPDTRARLRALMAAHRYTDVATITRDDIAGAHGYTDLREMHSGHGQVCHGAVDRSAWAADRHERGLVYCTDAVCVIVPTICNNVSLVSRKPDAAAVLDDTPIDISPSAGPSPQPADATATPAPTAAPADATPPLDFFPAAEGGGGAPTSPIGDAGNGGGGQVGGFPGGGIPIGGGGGGGDCCAIGPIIPTGPGAPITPPVITSPGPEAPTWSLLLAGIALTAAWWRRQRRRGVTPDRAAGARAPATARRRTRPPSRH